MKTSRSQLTRLYPWEDWFDTPGGFAVESGRDYFVPDDEMRAAIYYRARKYGRRVAVGSLAFTAKDLEGFNREPFTRLTVDFLDTQGGPLFDIEPVQRRPAPAPYVPYTPKPRGAKELYPWAEWFDGAVHVLQRGVDFETSAHNFAILARQKSNSAKYPFPIDVSRRGDTVTIFADTTKDPRFLEAIS